MKGLGKKKEREREREKLKSHITHRPQKLMEMKISYA